ncbi:MAG: hypothetical protein RLZZ204_218 [Bacteroidota bacterium]|jgi:hypothetical protein
MKLNYLFIATTLLFLGCKKDAVITPYSLTVSDGSVIEGNAGENKVIEFEVALDQAVSGSDNIRIKVATADGTAKSGEDFIVPLYDDWGLVPQGTRSKKIQIEIVEDVTKESTEEFSIVVSSPSPNVKIVDGVGKGTILNDD